MKNVVPQFLENREPPIVSYSYSRTISGRIFNQRTVVEELDVDRGMEGICWDCSASSYCYVLAGHVVTGD